MRLFYVLILILTLLLPLAPARAGDIPVLPRDFPRGHVAAVADGHVSIWEIFAVWEPLWAETAAKVRAGLSPEAGDVLLQTEWEAVLNAAIRDELFYREATQHFELVIRSVARDLAQGGGYTVEYVEKQLRATFDRDLKRELSKLNEEQVKMAGGVAGLQRAGVSYDEWHQRLRKKAVAGAFFSLVLSPRVVAPTNKEVQDYYRANPDEFARPGPVLFRHLYFDSLKRDGTESAREAALHAWRAIQDGMDFAEAARQFSDDRVSAAEGGLEKAEPAIDPGREAWLIDLRKVAREEPVGRVSAVLESPAGFHIVRTLAVAPGRALPFEEAQKEIQAKLMGRRWQAEQDRLFEELSKQVPVRVLQPRFPPELSMHRIQR